MIGRLNHVGVVTPLIEPSIALYRDLLDAAAGGAGIAQAAGQAVGDPWKKHDNIPLSISGAR